MQSISSLVKQLKQIPIIFVGGKGGVGKTTTAAVLATKFASTGFKTLIISTDPAHSLGDVFNVKLKNTKTYIHENLDAIELNPDEIINKHFEQVERTIISYANPDLMPKIREHLKLSKSAPGAQEAAMLEAICTHLVNAVNLGEYKHIIFDTAPTGHTLRLLILPEMMEAWTEGLLTQQRRQAKLKSAADNLTTNHLQHQKSKLTNPFAKATPNDRWERAVEVLNKRKSLFMKAGSLLHDGTKTAVVLVMTADNLPIEETKRAVKQLEDSKLSPAAIVINQLINTTQTDKFWQQRASRQQKLLSDIKKHFKSYPLYGIYLQQTDIRGFDQLKSLL